MNRQVNRQVKGLADLTAIDLEIWVQQVRPQSRQGQVMQRIPRLAQANPDWFAVAIHSTANAYHCVGEVDRPFPLMSVIKPFQFLYLLEHCGLEPVLTWVGITPSDAPFNSLEQLVADRGKPRNPMINSGAITLSDKLPGTTATERCQRLCAWLNQRAGCQLNLDQAMLQSVRSAGREPNQALVRYLVEVGALQDANIALDTYEQICCLSGTVSDLAGLGYLLAIDRGEVISQHRRTVNAVMLTCGLYEASANYGVQIGLPMKSGISGGLVAVVPQQGAIACYSPALDRIGNPVAGIALVDQLSSQLQLSLFG